MTTKKTVREDAGMTQGLIYALRGCQKDHGPSQTIEVFKTAGECEMEYQRMKSDHPSWLFWTEIFDHGEGKGSKSEGSKKG